MKDPVLEALWKRVLDAWEDDGAHGAFLKHCQETDQLLEAAYRYRGMAGDRDRGTVAEKRLKGVALLAMTRLESSRVPGTEAGRTTGRLLLIVFFLSSSLALLYYAFSGPG